MADPMNLSGRGSPDGRVHLSFAGGVDNRSHLAELPAGFVRKAENVEIDERGVGGLRDGYALWVALPGAHSLWDHPLLTFALVADASSLYRLDEDGTLTALATGLNGSRLSYAVIGRHAYWSNGVQTGRVDLLGTAAGWGVETPLPSFGVSAVANGGLFAGRYGVSMTFTNAVGEEGGAPETEWVDVAEGAGIQVSGVPVSGDGLATAARIYVTSANGTELFHATTVAPGTAVVMIGAGQRGKQLATQFCEPFPPAGHLLAKAGRLIGAVGRRLVWSQALYPGLWRPTQNSLTLPDEITMVAAPDSPQFVLYVATRKRVYVLQGESIDTASLSVACAAGAQPGSMAMLPAEVLHMDGVLTPTPLWAGTDGVPYAGMVSGVVPLTDKFVYPIYDQAAAGFVQQGGLSRFIVSGQGGKTSGLAMGDRVSAEVIQAGP